MSCKSFFPINFESVFQIIHNYAVIHRLSHPVFSIWVQFCSRNWMHIWLECVLNHDWNSKLPLAYFLFICCCDKISSFVKKGDCVNCSCMFSFVFKTHFPFPCVILKDMFIIISNKKRMLMSWINDYTEWKTSVVIWMNYFSFFCIPFLNNFIHTCRNHFCSIIRNIKTSHNFFMSYISSNTFSVSKHIP